MQFESETLPSGIRATFVTASHFMTTAAELTFHAGSLHEDPLSMPQGVAHFLEHTPFQATKDFPTQRHINNYVESDGSHFNAATSQTTTSYEAAGMDSTRVLNTVFQLGFHPLLTRRGLESDRNAVVEEAREHQFSPYRGEQEDYETRVGGARYSQLITGNIQDVASITHRHIMDFYRRHYQPSNASLTVCSNLSITKQKALVNRLASNIDLSRADSNPTPVTFNLPWLTPEDAVWGFHNRKDEYEAQSGVAVAYAVEAPPESLEEYILLEIAVGLINKALFTKIREQLNLAYDAGAVLTELCNTNHGLEESYFAIEAHTSLKGSNVVQALEAFRRVEDTVARDHVSAGVALNRRLKTLLKISEANPYETLGFLDESAQPFYKKRIDLAEERKIIAGITAKQVMARAAQIVRDRRLLGLAGPSTQQLKAAVRHASKM